jgi:hypothetical protein
LKVSGFNIESAGFFPLFRPKKKEAVMDPQSEIHEQVLDNPVAASTPVVAESPAGAPEDPIAQGLLLARQTMEDKITAIDQEVKRLNAVKDGYLSMLHQEAGRASGISSTNGKRRGRKPKAAGVAVASTTPRKAPDKKSVRGLILDYMENARKATTAEIRQYLDDLGRSTNPGVELGRLVKKGLIKHAERGSYAITK